MNKRDRLSLRIPGLIEAVAEGPGAIRTLFVLILLVIITKGLGWW
jgi:hypothetical protein